MKYVSDGSVSTVATVFDVVTVILVLVSASVYIYMLLLSMLLLFTIATLDNKVYPYHTVYKPHFCFFFFQGVTLPHSMHLPLKAPPWTHAPSSVSFN